VLTQSYSLLFTPLTKLFSRKVHAYVNARFTLDEQCLRKIDERSANYEE